MFAGQVRGVWREVRSLKDSQLVEPFSTIIVASGNHAELTAFSYGRGGWIAPWNVVSDKSHTNMQMANQFIDEKVEVIGLEWTIPPLVSAALLGHVLRQQHQLVLAPILEAYQVRILDVIEFARYAQIRFMVGGEKPLVEWPAITKPIMWSMSGARQQVRFGAPLPISRIEKFWAEINFGETAPVFGQTSNPDYRACLPIVFRLFSEADADVHAQWSDVTSALGVVRGLNDKLQSAIDRLMLPAIDPEVLVVLKKIRARVNSDAHLLDLLTCVLAGIKT